MLPPAPGRFSITTDCDHFSPSFWPRKRVTTSVAPAGGKGTMILTALLG